MIKILLKLSLQNLIIRLHKMTVFIKKMHDPKILYAIILINKYYKSFMYLSKNYLYQRFPCSVGL